MADYALALAHKSQLEGFWQDYQKFRGETGIWTQLIRRKLPVPLEPELAEYSGGIDIQSSDLETEAILRKQILGLNPAKVDVIALEEGVHAKKDAEDVRIWLASWMMELDAGLRVSDINSIGQITKGKVSWRIHWKEPPEPDGSAKQDGEDDDGYNSRSLKERDKYFQELPKDTFSLKHVPEGSIMHFPLDDPTVVIEETDVPYLEWREYQKNGSYLKQFKEGEREKVAFIGNAMESVGSGQTPVMHVLTHAYQVPGTHDWKLCEYIYPASSSVDDGEILNEVDSPLGCPYEFVPSGEEWPTETDPHFRYRPAIYGNIVTTQEQNYWHTILAAHARRAINDERLYIPLRGTDPDVLKLFQASGFTIEGAGAEPRLVFRRPSPGSGELMMAPELAQVPATIPDSILLRVEQLERKQQEQRTNRFLAGQATSQEISQGTGSAITLQTQQATLPFDASLTKQKLFWESLFEKMRAAILYWDKDTPEGSSKKYYVIGTGDEPIAKGKVEPGSRIYVDYAKLSRKIKIIVSVKNVTSQEQTMLNAAAYADFDRGTITEEQLLDRLGFDDPGKQNDELNRERHLVEARAQFKQAEDDERRVLWSAMTGLNLAGLGQSMAQPQQPMPQQAPQTLPMPRPGMAPPTVSSPGSVNTTNGAMI